MRRLVAVGSVSGAPGVTTTVLALAAAWPPEAEGGVRPVVVEMDSSGGDLMIRFGLPVTPSLLDVAAAAGKPHPGSLLGAASELPFGVRAVVAVPGRDPCRQAVRLLVAEAGRGVLLGDGDDRGTVLLDVGRLADDVEPLLAAADQVVLVTRGGPEALTHVSAYGLESAAYAGRLTLAVVGPCPYAPEEVQSALGTEPVFFLPWDAKSVAAMDSRRRGGSRTGGLRPPPLMVAARTLARRLAGSSIAADTDGVEEEADVGPQQVGRSWRGLVQVAGAKESRS